MYSNALTECRWPCRRSQGKSSSWLEKARINRCPVHKSGALGIMGEIFAVNFGASSGEFDWRGRKFCRQSPATAMSSSPSGGGLLENLRAARVSGLGRTTLRLRHKSTSPRNARHLAADGFIPTAGILLRGCSRASRLAVIAMRAAKLARWQTILAPERISRLREHSLVKPFAA